MRARVLLAIAALAALVVRCGGGFCPNDLPSACPSTPPSWAADVQPVVASRCAGCHGPGGVSATVPLVTYGDVYARRSAVLDQVYACRMPKSGSLAADERAKLLAWLVCGAPDN